jgi:uncharacterized protein
MNIQSTTPQLRLSLYHVATPPFIDTKDNILKRVIFSTRNSNVRVITDSDWSSILDKKLHRITPHLLQQLVAEEFLVPEAEVELETILERNRALMEADRNLFMVVQPTAYCQLDCGYCGQKHFKQWLSTDYQNAFIERIRNKLETKKYESLTIGWFGAEPLSGISVIRSLTPQLIALAANYDCTYNATMVTNGLALTDKIATEMINTHVIRSINITLDGTKPYHDSRRFRKDGKGTFDRIFENVVSLSKRNDLEVDILIRTNVDRNNYLSVLELIHKFAEAGIQDKITYNFAPIHAWGNDADAVSLTPVEFANYEIEWFAEMLHLGFSVPLVPSRVNTVCMAVMPDSELVDAEGNLFNCTEVSYVPTYGSPNEYGIGHVIEGTDPNKREKLGDFAHRVKNGDYPCTTCRMYPVCGGACPKLWREGYEPCPSAKRNIEHRLLLSISRRRLFDTAIT